MQRRYSTRAPHPAIPAFLACILILAAIVLAAPAAATPQVELRDEGGVLLSPGVLVDYGTWTQTSTSSPVFRIYTLTNVGDADLTLSSVSMSVGYRFVVTGVEPPVVLAPGESQTFNVRFRRDVVGPFTDTVSLISDDPASPFVYQVTGSVVGSGPQVEVRDQDGSLVSPGDTIDYGQQPLGEPVLFRIYTLTNVGDQDLQVTSAALAQSNRFILSGIVPPVTLAPGASHNFNIRYRRDAAGTHSDTFSLGSNDPDDDPFVFPVLGSVVASAAIAVTTGTGDPIAQSDLLEMPDTAVHTANGRTFVVHNQGDEPLVIDNAQNMVEGAGYFVIEDLFAAGEPHVIAPGDSRDFRVRLLTHQIGTHGATVTIENSDVNDNPFIFYLIGEVGIANFNLAVQPASRGVQAGGTASYTVNVISEFEFDEPVTLSLSGAPSGASGTFNPPTLIPPGNSTLSLATSPTTPSGLSALTITGSGGGLVRAAEATLTVHIDNAAVSSFSAPSPVSCGQSFTATVTMTNTGTATWTSAYKLGLAAGSDPFYSGSPIAVTGSVPGGASHSFTLNLTAPPDGGLQPTQWRMRNASGTPFGDVASTSVQVNCGGGPEPTIDSVTPDKIFQGAVHNVSVTGANFHGASVEIADEKFDPNDPNRIYPFVQGFSVHGDGSQINVTVNATQSGIDGYYNLIVSTSSGLGSIEVRVVPQRPVVDMYTPSEVSPGGFFLVSINGANLAGTSISASSPQVRLVAVNSADDKAISALLAVDEGALPGSFNLVVSGNGGSAILPMTASPGEASFQRQTVNLMENMTAEQLQTTFQGLPVPKIYLQEFTIHDGLESMRGLALSAAAARSKTLTPAEQEKILSCLFGFTKRLFSFTEVFVIPLGELGSFDPQVLQGLGLGEIAALGALTFSVFTDLAIDFSFDFCRFSDFNFCIYGNLGFEVPGIGGFINSFQFCFPFGLANFSFNTQTTGSLIDDFHFSSGGQCTTVTQSTTPANGGLQLGQVELTECCSETIFATTTGQTFVGTFFEGTFSGTVPLATVVPDATCNPVTPVLKLFLDTDNNNNYTPGTSIPLSQLTDIESYVPCASSSGTSVQPSALPQQVQLVAAFVNEGTNSAAIVPPSGATPSVTFELEQTSAFLGIAGNFGTQTSPDFSLDGATGTTVTASFDSNHLAKVTLLCHDYGGFTQVTATADTGEADILRIPLAGNDGLLPQGGWKTFASTQINNTGLLGSQDIDNNPAVSGNPGVGITGDGLSNYEEYRGFIVREQHRRTNPFKKDVFISSNLATGISFASPNLPLATHRIYGQDEPQQTREYGPIREINFNHTNSGHGGDIVGYSIQRAIRGVLVAIAPVTGRFGRWFRFSGGGVLGSPNESDRVEIYIDTHTNLGSAPNNYSTMQISNETRRSFGHEVGHGLHICHRQSNAVCPDPVGTADSIMSSAIFPVNGQSTSVSQYNNADTAQIRVHQN